MSSLQEIIAKTFLTPKTDDFFDPFDLIKFIIVFLRPSNIKCLKSRDTRKIDPSSNNGILWFKKITSYSYLCFRMLSRWNSLVERFYLGGKIEQFPESRCWPLWILTFFGVCWVWWCLLGRWRGLPRPSRPGSRAPHPCPLNIIEPITPIKIAQPYHWNRIQL